MAAPTNMNEHLEQMITTKGWLAIDSLYFDNGMVINIAATRGYIAIAKSINCLVTFSNVDILDAERTANSIVKFHHRNLSHGSTIVMGDLAGLQRYNVATYMKTSAVNGVEELNFPTTIPNVINLDTYDTELDSLVTGTLELVPGDKPPINATPVFDPTKVREIDQAWYDMDYIKDTWFKNKKDFNKKVADYLGLLPTDII